jgi:uncharacterized protein (DUF362 family)
MSVAIVKMGDQSNPVKTALEMSDGLRGLKPSHSVLIKPNLVIGGRKGVFPPFGKVTTSFVIEKLVKHLLELGCTKLAIGEGSALAPELGMDTTSAFKFSGVERVARQHGIQLIDFESGPYESVRLDDHPFKIAKADLETDFLINVPVLKTHGQTIVSLGMKNLKGCLKFSSKKHFHKLGILSRLIALLNQQIRSHLTIIDGTFGLDRGPIMGTAHRMDLLVAGTDVLETELVGASLLGKNPADILHIREFGRITGRGVDLDQVEIKGPGIGELAKNLPWESDPNLCFARYDLKGIRVASETGDPTICTGCSVTMEYPHYMFAKDNPRLNMNGMDVCIGENARPNPQANRIVLLGDCAIKHHKEAKNAIAFPGCPPDMGDYLRFLMNSSLPKIKAKKQLLVRLMKIAGFKLGLYTEDFGLWERYQSPEFDRSLYE